MLERFTRYCVAKQNNWVGNSVLLLCIVAALVGALVAYRITGNGTLPWIIIAVFFILLLLFVLIMVGLGVHYGIPIALRSDKRESD